MLSNPFEHAISLKASVSDVTISGMPFSRRDQIGTHYLGRLCAEIVMNRGLPNVAALIQRGRGDVWQKKRALT